MIFCIKRK